MLLKLYQSISVLTEYGVLNVSGRGFAVDMIGHEPHRTGEFDEDGNEITTPRSEYLVNVRTKEPNEELAKINRVVLTPVESIPIILKRFHEKHLRYTKHYRNLFK